MTESFLEDHENRLSRLEVRFEELAGTLRVIELEQVHLVSSFDSWHRAIDKGQELIMVKIEKVTMELSAKIESITIIRDQLFGAWKFMGLLAAIGLFGWILRMLVR